MLCLQYDCMQKNHTWSKYGPIMLMFWLYPTLLFSTSIGFCFRIYTPSGEQKLLIINALTFWKKAHAFRGSMIFVFVGDEWHYFTVLGM